MESHLKEVLHNLPLGVLLIKGQRIIYYNQWFQEFFHIEGDIKGMDPRDIEPHGLFYGQKRGQLVEYEEDHLFMTSYSLSQEETLFLVQTLNFLEDLNHELRRLMRLEKTLKTILNSMDEGVHLVDEKGKTIFYNNQSAFQDGLAVEDVLGRDLLEVYPSLTHETSTLLRTLCHGDPISLHQQTYINYQGKKITTLNKTVPIHLDGEFIGALEVSRDITQIRELAERVLHLQEELGRQFSHEEEVLSTDVWTRYTFDDLIGHSQSFKEMITRAKKVALSMSPVLIYGETGTGKELFAQSIHRASNRSKGPFIAQNCGALPRDLLEGILFGTVKGGFTGAVDRAGIFEQAHGGTLLLDEINSMDPELQVKLLRVLQEKRLRRVGGEKEIEIDIRLIATTNTPPLEAMEEKRLRQDLYYRLGVAQIHIPPLRERREDIPILLKYFLEKFSHRMDKEVAGVTRPVMEFFQEHNWPGNVRELEHVIEGAMNFIEPGETISFQHLPPHLKVHDHHMEEETWEGNHTDVIEEVERSLLKRALEKEKWNISHTAERLKIRRQTLQYKMRKYGL